MLGGLTMLRSAVTPLAGALLYGLAALQPAAAAESGEEGVTKTWAFAEFGEPLYDESMEHWPYVNPDAPVGGQVTISDFGAFDSFNPYILKGEFPSSIGLLYDSLMVGSGDELASYYGQIATSVEYPEDVSWAIFNLNPEARFHDGHPIEADDFVFTFDTIKEHGRPFLKAFYEDIVSAEALGPHRLKYTFATRNSKKPLGIVASSSPQPRHWWEERDISESTLEPPLGSGPYEIASVDPGRSIVYRRVDDYWGADLPVNRGTYNFETIRYDYYRDRTVEFEAFKAGKVDFWGENSVKQWYTGYDFPAVNQGRVIKAEVENETPRAISAYFFNLRRDKFKDARVRKAINYLYDFETLQRTLLYGEYTRSESYFPNSDFGAEGPPSELEKEILQPYAEQIPSEVLSEDFTPPITDGSGRDRKNLRQALKLFAEAGWTLENGRMVNAQGEQFSVEIITGSPEWLRLGDQFVQNLKRAGIDASMRLLEPSQWRVVGDRFDFDMMTARLNFFPPPGTELRSYFGSAAAKVDGSANIMGIENPVVDDLIEQIVAADSLETLKATNRALDRVLLWNYYLVPTYYLDESWYAYWDKFGFPEKRARYSPVGFPSTWWIDSEKAAALKQ
jgi:microcin C transport system substrate-binding protein